MPAVPVAIGCPHPLMMLHPCSDGGKQRLRWTALRAQGALAAPHRRSYDHPGMLELQAAAQHGWGSSPPGQPSVLDPAAEAPPPRVGAWPMPPQPPPCPPRGRMGSAPVGAPCATTLVGEHLPLGNALGERHHSAGGGTRRRSAGGGSGGPLREGPGMAGTQRMDFSQLGAWAMGVPGGGGVGRIGFGADAEAAGNHSGGAHAAALLPGAWMLSPESPGDVVTWPGLPSPPRAEPARGGSPSGGGDPGPGGGGGGGGGGGAALANLGENIRMSIKLLDAGPRALQPGLRRELEAALGGPGEVANLQAAVRPGCVHIVADALVAAARPAVLGPLILARACVLSSASVRPLLVVGCIEQLPE